MYRRAMILDVGGWNEKLIHGEELTMHLGCLRTGWRVGMVDIATGVYRIYFGNKSRSCTDGGSTGKLLPKALALGKWQRAQIDYWGVNIVIASLGHRAHGLKRVVGEFRNKCEHMYLALHGYDSVPEWANHSNITARLSQDEGNNGTADKFTWNEEIAHRPGGGYIVHMDDDVLYPEDYVEVMRRKVDKFRKKAVVCAHGSRVTANPVNNFYDDRVNLHFKHAVKDNTPVHVPGIVCTAYHTDTISLKREDFIGAHTQDDIYMAVQCQKQQVPVICIKRAAKWIVVNPDVSAVGSICQRYRGGCPDVSDTINSVQPLKLWTIKEGVVECASSL